jgi:hypothetical protein
MLRIKELKLALIRFVNSFTSNAKSIFSVGSAESISDNNAGSANTASFVLQYFPIFLMRATLKPQTQQSS